MLVTSSSLTEDIYKTFLKRSASERELVAIGRSAVVLVSIVAGLLALDPDSSILSLVGNAWAGFGAAFGPAILFSLRWKRTTQRGRAGRYDRRRLVVIGWILLGWSSWLYEIVPGFIASSLAIWLVSRATAAPSEAIEKQFDEAAIAARPGA